MFFFAFGFFVRVGFPREPGLPLRHAFFLPPFFGRPIVYLFCCRVGSLAAAGVSAGASVTRLPVGICSCVRALWVFAWFL